MLYISLHPHFTCVPRVRRISVSRMYLSKQNLQCFLALLAPVEKRMQSAGKEGRITECYSFPLLRSPVFALHVLTRM